MPDHQTSMKTPPSFGDSEDKDYASWKNELEIWRRMTEMVAKKQALAIVLNLSGKARQLALQVPVNELDCDNGVDNLLKKLDECFKREEVDCAYEAYFLFEKFKRSQDMSVSAYILEFERLYNKAKQYNMTLPDAVLAFKLLDSAALENKDRQMVLSACQELNFERMRSSLKRIFGDTRSDTYSTSVKEEPAFFGSIRNSKFPKKPAFRPYQKHGPNKGRNPIGRDGKVSRCSNCESVNHWYRDCPDKKATSESKGYDSKSVDIAETEEEGYIVLFNQQKPINQSPLAILDTACTANVCGEEWLDAYLPLLSEEDSKLVCRTKSATKFVFGGGDRRTALYAIKIPVQVNKTRCFIKTDVIPGPLPLLISKRAMQCMDAVLDTRANELLAFDWTEPMKLSTTDSGHYAISLEITEDGTWMNKREIPNFALKTDIDSDLTDTELVKLHKQFAHCSSSKLVSLLNNAGIKGSNYSAKLEQIQAGCEICARNGRSRPRPNVGLPLATKFNEVLAMDLHQVDFKENIWFLHMIDEYSRFSVATIIYNKKAETIFQLVVSLWFYRFGPPDKIHVDNGGEFNNDLLRSLCEQFGVRLLPSPAYSPWSNGTCERHNGIITEMLAKLVDEQPSVSLDQALEHAVFAKKTVWRTRMDFLLSN